jgi:hypothetical protein
MTPGLWASRRWWLVPLLVVLGIVAVALTGLTVAHHGSPFVYTVF